MLKHGQWKTRTYRAWAAMKSRVRGVDDIAVKHYVDRGIEIDPAWSYSFVVFWKDMGDCPPKMSLDRVDNDKGYGPGNCRWATQKQQVSNTRRTVWVIFGNREMCLKDACAEAGLSYELVRSRIRYGATPQEALDCGVVRWTSGKKRRGVRFGPHSAETKSKIRAALAGRTISDEVRANMKAGWARKREAMRSVSHEVDRS